MSLSIKVDWDPGLLKRGGLKGPMMRALRKAGGTALRDMRAEAVKRVRQRKRIKASVIRKAITMRRAKGSVIERLEWALNVSGRPVRAVDYPHRQIKRGVSIGINRTGRTVIKSAFVATMKSGHKGIFVRRGVKRLPIREQYASRVTDALGHKGEVAGIMRRGSKSFAETYARMLPLEIARVAK